VLDWFGSLPLAGERLVTTATNSHLATILEDNGAEVIVLPMPVAPAARVLMSALPLSGCIVRTRADVDWLDDEMNNPGWAPESIAWCVGHAAVERALERGWTRVVELEDGIDCDALVSRIADMDGGRG
jgi:hypothetical protein